MTEQLLQNQTRSLEKFCAGFATLRGLWLLMPWGTTAFAPSVQVLTMHIPDWLWSAASLGIGLFQFYALYYKWHCGRQCVRRRAAAAAAMYWAILGILYFWGDWKNFAWGWVGLMAYMEINIFLKLGVCVAVEHCKLSAYRETNQAGQAVPDGLKI